MLSFLNTVEILPLAQVDFIAETLGGASVEAAILLKAKSGLPGFVSLNAWMANAEPICRSIPTELVCCAERRDELGRLLQELIEEIQAAMANRNEGSIERPPTGQDIEKSPN